MKKTLFTAFVLLSVFFTYAQQYWTSLQPNSLEFLEPQINARSYSLAELDVATLDQILRYAPEFDVTDPYRFTNVQIEIPLPAGGFERYKVFNAPVMEPELAAKYPEINTYMAVAVSGRNYGRIDLTPKGFHAMIFTTDGTYFVDPYSGLTNQYYISYYRKDFYTDKTFECLHNESNDLLDFDNPGEQIYLQQDVFTPKLTNGSQLRRYRAAISATGEYTQFHGGTVALGLAAIVTSLNRISGVYERDFSITFQLVANNDLIVFTNPATDPFTNNDAGAMINQNPTAIGNAIGAANYDIGHVFATAGSGLASQGVCGSTNNKARGVTGIAQPIGDPFDIDYVSHEIGHQFSASHTFNSTSNSCGGGNRSAANAFEPGSGSTIMAYAGLCTPENLQTRSDDYFHTRSYIQVYNYAITGAADACPVKTNTGNSLPNITSITQSSVFTIPKETPFQLTATATDADGDLLTYCWEQYNQQTASTVITNPTGDQPIFRSFNPVTTGTRVFPRWSDILNNTTTIGERLPTYGRTMLFRLLVRDNRPGAGGTFITNFNDNDPPSVVRVTVTNNAGPFLVTSPNTASVVWSQGSNQTVTWNVAGTTGNGVNCANVDILLSTDGGQNFNITLAQGVPNNGTASITVPVANTNQARVMVRCSNNIFFDVSNFNFSIQFDCSSVDASITINSSSFNANLCVGDNHALSVDAFSPDLDLTYQWFFNGNPIDGATEADYFINNIQTANAGVYVATVSNVCNSESIPPLTLFVNPRPDAPTLLPNGDQLVSTFTGDLQWYLNGVAIPGANSFIYEPVEEGVYTVAAIIDGCESAQSNPVNFQFTNPSSLNSLDQLANVLIYPNPSTGNFSVAIDNWNNSTKVSIYDILGKLMLVENAEKGFVAINASEFAKGTYFVKIESEKVSAVRKIVIE